MSEAALRSATMRDLFVTGLRCVKCGKASDFDSGALLCRHCGASETAGDPAVLDVEYDYEAARSSLRSRGSAPADVFRYESLLPVRRPDFAMLRAGGTPLVSAPRMARRYGLRELWLKDETRNATRCLKDRATAVAVALATSRGSSALYCASAGNAAISLAGFCAQAGLDCHAYVPNGVSEQRLEWLKAFGARVQISSGDYDTAYAEAERDAAAHGWYSRNCAFNPFLVEGKKTVAHEIADEIGVPDFVVAPVGDGCTLAAIGKGFREQLITGLRDSVPRLVGVQSDRIRPLVDRFEGHAPSELPVPDAPPLAASIAVRRPRNALRLLRELKASDGILVDVTDQRIVDAQQELASTAGLVAEHTSAATLAALERLAERESIAGKSVVLVITGGRVDTMNARA